MNAIDIRPLLGADRGESLPFALSADRPKLPDVPALRDLKASGDVSKVDAGFLVAGTLTGTIRLECARCLKPFDHPLSLAFSEEFALEPGDEQFPAGKERLDPSAMFRFVILTHLPERPLHDPACQGLCATCGKDLNEEPHEHPPEDTDEDGNPFSKLKKLKD
ncbi:MAG TPA: DUF177 domain-containing protein [Patescibacteria group bacterium]|jgi:uncharacterized protein